MSRMKEKTRILGGIFIAFAFSRWSSSCCLLYTSHIKEFHAHVSHSCKEIAKKAYELTVDPVNELVHQSAKEKV